MLFDLTTYQLIWWGLVGLVLMVFCFTAGFDLGVGILLRIIGKTNDERRVLINVIAPHWDGNQVWLIIAGVCLFGVWPRAYTVAFTGFYGGLMLMLWSLYLRPTGFEWRAKIESDTWRGFWDWGIFIGSFLPAFAPGLLFGNILQGLNFQYDQEMRFIFTGHVEQLFNPFGIACGLLSVFLLVTHGANYLQMRTTGEINRRCAKAARFSAIAFLFCLISIMVALYYFIVGFQLTHAGNLIHPLSNAVTRHTGGWYHNYILHPVLWLAPISCIVGAVLVVLASHRKPTLAFLSSALMIIGTIASYGFGTFPFMLPSASKLAHSLTIWNASSSQYSLQIIFIVAVIFIPIIIAYTIWGYAKLWRKIDIKTVKDNDHVFY